MIDGSIIITSVG